MTLKHYPTLLGYSALLFWALAAPLTVCIKGLPIFETLTVVFSISFILSATKLTIYQQWQRLKQPWFLWVIGFVGIYGNDLLYISAFKYAPAAHAELINYLWPILVILFTICLPNEKLYPRHVIAALFGFSGIYVLIKQGSSFDSQYYVGYLLAFLDACVWAIYTLVSRHFGKSPVEMIGIYSGVAAICSLLIHIGHESFVLPSHLQWLVLATMGLTTQCLAYFFWDFGIKKGNFKLLSILSYGNPLISITTLILLGMATFSKELIIACLLVSTGSLIGVVPWQAFANYTIGPIWFDRLLTYVPKSIITPNKSSHGL